MTTFAERPTMSVPRQGVQKTSLGSQFVKTITSTDHKRIGYLYLATSFFWFLFAEFWRSLFAPNWLARACNS